MFELMLAVSIVIVISGMCSLFEAVLYAAPKGHIESMAASDNRSGKVMKELREQVDRPITAILSLNTIANTAGAAVAGALAAQVLDANGLIVFSAIFTCAILLFSEVLPKTIGVIYAKPLSGLVAYPLKYLVLALYPVIGIVGVMTRAVAGNTSGNDLSDDEIISMTLLGEQQGVFNESESKVIQNILALDNKTIHDVMTPRTVVFMLQASCLVKEAVVNENLHSHSRIPLYGERPDEIVGVVLRRDILRTAIEKNEHLKLEDLSQQPVLMPESTQLDQVLEAALNSNFHLIIALDQFGGFAGVVTLEDILEEILGREIVDESDQVVDLRELAEQQGKEILSENVTPS